MFPEVYEMLTEQPLVTAYLEDFFSIDIMARCYDDLALSAKEKRYPVLYYSMFAAEADLQNGGL